jgi:hypothetical protein
MNDAAPDREHRSRHRVDLLSTVLLALATVATAWSGYQASRWHSEQAKHQAEATASRIEATRSEDDANREVQVDVALFIQWVDARAQGDSPLADFYRARFTDRFTPAFQAWIATKPFDRPQAPESPFAMRQYSVEASEESASQEADANAAAAEAVDDIQRADNYVLAVVLFAVCLFFAGISTKLRTPTGQAAILALGWALFCGTLVWIATFPVSVTV